MQPSLRSRRRIGAALRPEPKLAYDRLSDPILVRRAKDGDAHALEALCARHAPRVGRLARTCSGDPEDARDAAQDALAKLCVKLGQFRGEAAFSTWLHRLTLNACRDVAAAARRPSPRAARREDARVAPGRTPDREAELSELRADLRDGLAELPAAQARVLVLKDALGFSFEEISAASGMPVGTAKCYAHRGRAAMRELAETESPRDSRRAFGKEEIESILPHRDPFLLLDEVVELEPGRKVVATRLVRADDWWFPGHFPERPVMPGVLIVEAMAQAGAVAVLVEEENRGKIAFFAGIDDCRFKRVVSPGETLTLTCEIDAMRGPVGRGKATATVEGALAARGTLTFAVER